jgi:hypothetical protein
MRKRIEPVGIPRIHAGEDVKVSKRRIFFLEPMHGYGIAVRLEQMSKGVLRLMQVRCFSPFSGCNERG